MRHTSIFLSLVFCLATVSPGLAQSVHYADDCISNVDNATTIIPPTVDPSLPNGASLAPGDTIAIQNPDGDCVGYGVWTNDTNDLAIAAAGPTAIPEARRGLSPGDSLSWTVFDESQGGTVDLGSHVVYASCDTVSVPTCQDDGTYADGAAFLLEAFQHPVYTVTVTGDDGTDNNAGWRMLSLPAAEATRASLEDDLDFSVMPWSVVRRWQDSQWTAQTSSDTLSRGTGFIFYFYDSNTNPVNSNGLRLDVAHGPENTTVDEEVGSLKQGQEWFLLGNPFPVSYDLGGLANGDLPAAGFQATVHVWDPEAGQYRLITQGMTGDSIAAWQGFFVQRSTLSEGQTSLTFDAGSQNIGTSGSLIGSTTARQSLTFEPTAESTGKHLHESSESPRAEMHLRLDVTERAGDPVRPDRVIFRLDPRADTGYDAYDAEKLSPVSGDGYASVTLPIMHDGDVLHRALGAVPPPTTNAPFRRTLPLSVRGIGIDGTATLAWPAARKPLVPDEWTVRLTDTEADSTINLRHQSYTFSLTEGTTISRPQEARFRLKLQSNASPITLAHLKGTASEKHVTLRWKTTSEQNNAGFRIERRTETDTPQWTSVGFVGGSGTTDRPRRYRFKDSDLPYAADSLQYRLRTVEKDGAASSSDPITVARNRVEAVELLGTYPNPASNQATVRYAVPETHRATTVQLLLYDALGRRIRTLQASGKTGRHERQFSVSDLASGVYFLRLRAGDVVKSRKLTVVR